MAVPSAVVVAVAIVSAKIMAFKITSCATIEALLRIVAALKANTAVVNVPRTIAIVVISCSFSKNAVVKSLISIQTFLTSLPNSIHFSSPIASIASKSAVLKEPVSL